MAKSKVPSLKELTNQFPKQEKRLEYIASLVRRPDRIAAISATAGMEQILMDAIVHRHLRADLSQSDLENLFDYGKNGILAPFGARIKIAYSLGIFGKQERADFVHFQRIRNAFAHSMMDVDFSSGDIPSIVTNLHIMNRPMTPDVLKAQTGTKQRFLSAVSLYYIMLLLYMVNSPAAAKINWYHGS